MSSVAALRTWMEADGAVFRAINRHGRIVTGLSDRAIALIVKRRAAAAGVDPADYSAHSLRAGCAIVSAGVRCDRSEAAASQGWLIVQDDGLTLTTAGLRAD